MLKEREEREVRGDERNERKSNGMRSQNRAHLEATHACNFVCNTVPPRSAQDKRINLPMNFVFVLRDRCKDSNYSVSKKVSKDWILRFFRKVTGRM